MLILPVEGKSPSPRPSVTAGPNQDNCFHFSVTMYTVYAIFTKATQHANFYYSILIFKIFILSRREEYQPTATSKNICTADN